MNTTDYVNHYANLMFSLKHKSLPVLMNIPIDVQISKITQLPVVKQLNYSAMNKDAFLHLKNILQNHNILLVTGNRSTDARNIINIFCEKYFILSASTLCSKGVIDESSNNYYSY